MNSLGKISASTLALIFSILAFIGGSAAQLNTIFSGVPYEAIVVQIVCGVSGYIGAIIGLVVAWKTRMDAQVANVIAHKDEPAVQTALVKTVSNYTGVEPIKANENASEALLKLANDPDVPKVDLASK